MTPITVTITHSQIHLSQATVSAGVIRLKIVNDDTIARIFSVAGRETPLIKPGGTGSLQVVLDKRRSYQYRSGSLSGWLIVIVPCTHPTQSTVDVRFALPTTQPVDATQTPVASMTFSKTTIPCGTVTFVVKNDAQVTDDLNLDLSLQGGPKRIILGPRLAPGQSTTMTVVFRLKGNVYYFSGEPEHDEGGEAGYLVID